MRGQVGGCGNGPRESIWDAAGFHGLQFLHLKAEDVNPVVTVSSPEQTSP